MCLVVYSLAGRTLIRWKEVVWRMRSRAFHVSIFYQKGRKEERGRACEQ